MFVQSTRDHRLWYCICLSAVNFLRYVTELHQDYSYTPRDLLLRRKGEIPLYWTETVPSISPESTAAPHNKTLIWTSYILSHMVLIDYKLYQITKNIPAALISIPYSSRGGYIGPPGPSDRTPGSIYGNFLVQCGDPTCFIGFHFYE